MEVIMRKLALALGLGGLAGSAHAVDYAGLVPDFTGGDAAVIAAATAVLSLLAVVVVARYVKSASH
jgi:hypothetical protein